jgi:hypothetical protein
MVSLNVRYSDRFGKLRPGYDLVSVLNVAIPVTFVRADVIAQKRKDVPLLEEFVLRLVAESVDTTRGIAPVLGVEDYFVEVAAANQIDFGNLDYSKVTGQLSLTDLGMEYVRELVSIAPVETTIEIAFDRVKWALASYRQREALTSREVDEQRLTLLRAPKSARITVADVPPRGMNDRLAGMGSSMDALEVLHVKKVHPDIHRFLPVELLIYAQRNGLDAGFELLVDGDLSEQHRDALAQSGELTGLGMRVLPPAPPPTLSTSLAEKLASGRGAQLVEGFEHWEVLENLISTAKSRLLITSVRASPIVVSRQFVTLLEARLASGVVIHVATRDCDDETAATLTALSNRYPTAFTFVSTSQVLDNVLIADDRLCFSSFRWLGFDALPSANRSVRLEIGALFDSSVDAEAEYSRQRSFVDEEASA